MADRIWHYTFHSGEEEIDLNSSSTMKCQYNVRKMSIDKTEEDGSLDALLSVGKK